MIFLRSIAAAWLAIAALGGSAAAQEQNRTTTFDIEINFIHDRLPPDPRSDINVRWRVSVTLSGRNDVDFRRTTQTGRFITSGAIRTTLGGEGQRIVWRVINAGAIQGTINYPNSVRTIAIAAGGSTCSVSMENRLKPGAATFRYRRNDGGGMADFSPPRSVNARCTVRAG